MSWQKVIYVSSESGDDANDGLTVATAVRTIKQAQKLIGDGIPGFVILKPDEDYRE